MHSPISDWLYSCVRCSNCKYVFRDYGPACPSGTHFGFESFFASGRLWLAHAIEKGEIDWTQDLMEPLFACTTCGSCEVQCLAPHKEHIVEMIEELRARAVRALGPLPSHRKFGGRIEDVHNPYGAKHHARALVDLHSLPDKAPLVYFVGCTANYRETEIRDATISLLKKSGLEFTIVDEYCCTSPLIRTGQIGSIRDIAHHNIDEIKRVGASQVVTSCAGCYRTFKLDYPAMGMKMEFDVMHISQILGELLSSGKLRPRKSSVLRATYHDPCHLGRHCGEYEAARSSLNQLPLDLVEMDYSRENAWCCGAGGGARSEFADWSLETAKKRLKMAMAKQVDMLVSTCPFCKKNLKDAADDAIEVLDLCELVDRLT